MSDAGGVIFDSEGIALYNTGGIGFGVVAGASVGGGISYSGVSRMEQLNGWGMSVGVTGGLLGILEITGDQPFTNDNEEHFGGTVAGGWGLIEGGFIEWNYSDIGEKLDWVTVVDWINQALPFGAQITTDEFFNDLKTTAINRIDNEISSAIGELNEMNKALQFFEGIANGYTNSEAKSMYQNNVVEPYKTKIREQQNKIQDLRNSKEEIENMEIE